MRTGVKGAAMLTDSMVRDAWLRAEALCECRKDTHGHAGRCNQFLIWAERGEVGSGGWEARRRDDPVLDVELGRLERALDTAGLEVIAPGGEMYTPELMNVIENIAQRVEAGLDAPRVAEVVEPAILHDGRVLRMGKAVIAVPEVKPGE